MRTVFRGFFDGRYAQSLLHVGVFIFVCCYLLEMH